MPNTPPVRVQIDSDVVADIIAALMSAVNGPDLAGALERIPEEHHGDVLAAMSAAGHLDGLRYENG